MTAASFVAYLLSVLALACTAYGLGRGMLWIVTWAEKRARGRKV